VSSGGAPWKEGIIKESPGGGEKNEYNLASNGDSGDFQKGRAVGGEAVQSRIEQAQGRAKNPDWGYTHPKEGEGVRHLKTLP